MFFKVRGIIFDLASFSFQVPIYGSAAKHTAAPKKQNARVKLIAFMFMCPIEPGFLNPGHYFSKLTAANDSLSCEGQSSVS